MTARPAWPRKWFAYGALAAAVLGIAWSAIFIRWADIPGSSSAFHRVFIAFIALVPWWLITLAVSSAARYRLTRAKLRVFGLALVGGALFALDLALYNTAVLRTTAATATLLGNSAPMFVGLGTWLLFRRRPERAFWIGLACAVAGAAIVMVVGPGETGRPRDLTGDLLALTAAMLFAGYMLTTERAREELDTLTFSTVSIAGSVGTLYVTCLLLRVPLGGFAAPTWAALLGLGLVSQLASYFALAYALGHLPATTTSVGLLAQVPLTALLAVPLLGEGISASQAVGGALVLLGIFIVTHQRPQP